MYEMKYKKLSKEQILISADRLTRFKYTKEKYIRVFSDIILSNLIEPKLKKKDILCMDYNEISDISTTIFNITLGEPSDNIINTKLKEYENSVYYNDKDTDALLNNNINYKEIIKLIPDDAPKNLLWLKSLNDINVVDYTKNREKFSLKYPIEEIILAEGITEEILLPEFSKFLGYDFDKKGIQIIAAGGKNQVVKMFYKLAHETKLPVFVLLDRDAEENINQIKPKLRKCDRIHLVSCGEFEDLLPKGLIIKTVNSHFKNFLKISENDINTDIPMAKYLSELFKTKGLHEFKKADFAKLVKANISDINDISDEIKSIISEIFSTKISLDSKTCS